MEADDVLDGIDADELYRRQQLKSTTDESDRPKCPSCGALDIRRKQHEDWRGSHKRKPGKWACRDCYEHFDEAVYDGDGA